MPRIMPTYTDDKLDAAITQVVTSTGWTSADLIADAAAEVLTHFSGDETAIEHARESVLRRIGHAD